MNIREKLKDKKRVVIKIGSSSLTHKETGRLDLIKMEILVRDPETGLRGHRSGQTDDDLSEAVLRV